MPTDFIFWSMLDVDNEGTVGVATDQGRRNEKGRRVLSDPWPTLLKIGESTPQFWARTSIKIKYR